MAQTLYDSFSGVARSASGSVIAAAEISLLNAIEQDPADVLNTAGVMYSDREGTTVIAQPLIAGADGSFEFFADAGYYHVKAVNGGDTFYVANTAIGTAQALDQDELGGGEVAGEVKIFVGPVPAGWERLSSTKPLTLPSGNIVALEDSDFPLEQRHVQARRNPVDGLVYMTYINLDYFVSLDADQGEIASIGNYTTITTDAQQSPRFCFDFSDDGLFVVALAGEIASSLTKKIEISTGAITTLASASALGTMSNANSQNWYSITNIGSDKFIVLTPNPTGSSASTCWEYDLTLNTWTAKTSRPNDVRTGKAALLPDGKLLAIGGTVGATATQSTQCDIYDPALDSWTSAGSLPVAIIAAHVEDVNPPIVNATSVLVAGQTRGVLLYDIATGVWSEDSLIGSAYGTWNETYFTTILESDYSSLGYMYLVLNGDGANNENLYKWYTDFDAYQQSQTYYARKL